MDDSTQSKALKLLQETRSNYENLLEKRMSQLTEVYKEYTEFTIKPQSTWSTEFKVNKMHEVAEKILPRIIARNPRWIVAPYNIDNFADTDDVVELRGQLTQLEYGTDEYRQLDADLYKKKTETAQQQSSAVQDYLAYLWDEYNMNIPARLFAKSGVVFGKAWCKVGYKYQTAVITSEIEGKEVKEEKVTGEYPCIIPKSFTEILYDPNYIDGRDRPAIIELTYNVRVSQILQNKNKYINVDKLKELAMQNQSDTEQWRQAVKSITGISDYDGSGVDFNTLTLTSYYGYFCPTDNLEDEKMYEIMTVNDLLVIKYEEIEEFPFEDWNCFEDPETGFARGFLEPIVGLQKELNFKKNSASEYINKALMRQVIWSKNSGIDPRTINDPVIVTSKTSSEAQANFIELSKPEINSSYFQESNDFERQIQGMTFTVDTANARSQEALTNTATGAKIKFYETNAVLDEVRKHFEQALENIAYKMLNMAFKNMDDNIVFKKQGSEGYWEMNKEALRNAIQKYSIKIEVGSSSYDDAESRREDAIAFFNLMNEAKQAGANVDVNAVVRDIVSTFEKKTPAKYMGLNIEQAVGDVMGTGGGQLNPEEMTANNQTQGERITKNIVGNI